MVIHQARKYELAPTPEQESMLRKTAGCARHTYNWCLAQCNERKEQTGKIIPFPELSRQFTIHKRAKGFEWLNEVQAVPLCDAVKDLNAAYQAFFKKNARYPAFKKKGLHNAFTVARSAGETMSVVAAGPGHVKLSIIGSVKLKEHLADLGRPINATVSRSADRWYIAVAYEAELPEPARPGGAPVGIDVGLKHFATLSDGTVIDAPKPLANYLKKLRRLQRQLSRKVNGSANRRKAAMKVARLHRRIANIRNDHAHKLSTELAKTKSVIAVETLNIKGMVCNDRLARHISDVAWGNFLRMLEYKCRWYGAELRKAGRWEPTSKVCSSCGHVEPELPLQVRNWTCPACGSQHDRDINAAANILKKAV